MSTTKTTKKVKKEIRFDELLDLVKYGIVKEEDSSAIALRILARLEAEDSVRIFDITRLVSHDVISAEEVRDFYKDTLFT